MTVFFNPGFQETQRTLISPFKGRESVVNLLIDGQCRRKFRIENNSKQNYFRNNFYTTETQGSL